MNGLYSPRSLLLLLLSFLLGSPALAQRLSYADLDGFGRAAPPRLPYANLDESAGPGDGASDRRAIPPGRPDAPSAAHPSAESGSGRVREFYLDRTELLSHRGPDSFVWDWSAYLGGQAHRLYVASTGEGDFGDGLGYLETQALYSRAIGNFDLQAGLRYDAVPGPERVYLTAGAQGFAIADVLYAGGFLFLSHRGELSARLFGTYDLPLGSRLVLQPSLETEFAAQDVPALGIGSGPIYAEAGLRLRYTIADAFSPYLGVGWERLLGRTARLAREAEEDTGGWSLLVGIRSWF